MEIAKLALWLHSARADASLSSLDGAVKCGNSLVAAYWRWLLLSGHARDPDSLEKALRRPPMDPSTPTARQFMERVARLADADAEIAREETAMNLRLFDLYGLTPEERRLIEAG